MADMDPAGSRRVDTGIRWWGRLCEFVAQYAALLLAVLSGFGWPACEVGVMRCARNVAAALGRFQVELEESKFALDYLERVAEDAEWDLE